MRTTISLSPECFEMIKGHVKECRKTGSTGKWKASVSTVIEEAVYIALPMMKEYLRKPGESELSFYRRRLRNLQQKMKLDSLFEQNLYEVYKNLGHCR